MLVSSGLDIPEVPRGGGGGGLLRMLSLRRRVVMETDWEKLGSGCIAALEAEKFLAEQEAEENPLEKEEDGLAKKPEVNGDAAPEYRSNPLL